MTFFSFLVLSCFSITSTTFFFSWCAKVKFLLSFFFFFSSLSSTWLFLFVFNFFRVFWLRTRHFFFFPSYVKGKFLRYFISFLSVTFFFSFLFFVSSNNVYIISSSQVKVEFTFFHYVFLLSLYCTYLFFSFSFFFLFFFMFYSLRIQHFLLVCKSGISTLFHYTSFTSHPRYFFFSSFFFHVF